MPRVTVLWLDYPGRTWTFPGTVRTDNGVVVRPFRGDTVSFHTPDATRTGTIVTVERIKKANMPLVKFKAKTNDNQKSTTMWMSFTDHPHKPRIISRSPPGVIWDRMTKTTTRGRTFPKTTITVDIPCETRLQTLRTKLSTAFGTFIRDRANMLLYGFNTVLSTEPTRARVTCKHLVSWELSADEDLHAILKKPNPVIHLYTWALPMSRDILGGPNRVQTIRWKTTHKRPAKKNTAEIQQDRANKHTQHVISQCESLENLPEPDPDIDSIENRLVSLNRALTLCDNDIQFRTSHSLPLPDSLSRARDTVKTQYDTHTETHQKYCSQLLAFDDLKTTWKTFCNEDCPETLLDEHIDRVYMTSRELPNPEISRFLAGILQRRCTITPKKKKRHVSHVCHTCGAVFSSADAQRVHTLSKHTHNPCVCDICGRSYTTMSNLARHTRIVHK